MTGAQRGNPDYTLYHPKWYRRRVPIFWWFANRRYMKFVARELTSVFVAYAAVLLLIQLWMVGRGESAYDRFAAFLAAPPALAFHGFVFVAVLFHSITWLNLAPKALRLRVAGRRVRDRWVVAAHYSGWLMASALLVWTLL